MGYESNVLAIFLDVEFRDLLVVELSWHVRSAGNSSFIVKKITNVNIPSKRVIESFQQLDAVS